ncbi:MAG: RP853 family protein [Rickettsiaceae bacterium]|nr:RP853 family protein [Rickettsiaceae bacterium]
MLNTKNSKEFDTIKSNKILIEESIIKQYGKYIPSELISKVSNLISIDHFYRLNLVPNIETHILNCLNNLGKYVEHNTIENSDFSQAMTLFVASITEYKENQDDNEILQKSQDVVIDNIINNYYPEIDDDLLHEMKLILTKLINEVGPKKALDSVSINPISFKNQIINKTFDLNKNPYLNLHHTQEQIKNTHPSHKNTLSRAVQIASVISAAPIASVIGIGATITTGLIAGPLIAFGIAENITENKVIQNQQISDKNTGVNLNFTEKYIRKKADTIDSKNAITQKYSSKKLSSKKQGNSLNI